jgi:hypothetical protein
VTTNEEASSVVTAPRPTADPRFLESLPEPSGALRQSEFYITRPGDTVLLRELAKNWGSTITIRASRQTGKSSLLLRAVGQAQQKGSKVVYLDLQPVDPQYLKTLDDFLRYLAAIIVSRLRLDVAEVDKAWKGSLGAPDKLTYLLEDYVLLAVNTRLVLALDEVDRLLQVPFQDTFFGLLRSWHNNRALNALWDKLDLALVISTEPYLLIKDGTQSPFNVGQMIRLQDFDAAQVRELNDRYRHPLAEHELPAIMSLLNGHPYLTHKALYTLVTEQKTWTQLRQIATSEQSPFGDHLRRCLWLLRDQPELRAALRHIVQHGECPDEAVFYRLSQAGLVQGATRNTCTYRCKLYEEFLQDRL